jgi:uncharacterized integral membrane protein
VEGVAIMSPRIILGLIVAIFYLVVVAQNTEIVTAKFFFWEFSMSPVILMSVMALIGFILGYVTGRSVRKRVSDKNN